MNREPAPIPPIATPSRQSLSVMGQPRFLEFVREERLFCAAVAHLLLQRGDNLRLFLELINAGLPEGAQLGTADVEQAEIYLEFTYLRDRWNLIGPDNLGKRAMIADWFRRVPSLEHLPDSAETFPEDIASFNELFMGPRGGFIRNDVVMPGQWSVRALSERFGKDPQVFRQLCKFKWSFNIKPDMVILIPGMRPVCVEAKLESREGFYPAGTTEGAEFDRHFGIGQGRVGQLELQEFMFEVLLDSPCQQVILSRDKLPPRPDGLMPSSRPQLTWQDVFNHLDTSSSISFVERLASQNRYLAPGSRVTIPGVVDPEEAGSAPSDETLAL